MSQLALNMMPVGCSCPPAIYTWPDTGQEPHHNSVPRLLLTPHSPWHLASRKKEFSGMKSRLGARQACRKQAGARSRQLVAPPPHHHGRGAGSWLPRGGATRHSKPVRGGVVSCSRPTPGGARRQGHPGRRGRGCVQPLRPRLRLCDLLRILMIPRPADGERSHLRGDRRGGWHATAAVSEE